MNRTLTILIIIAIGQILHSCKPDDETQYYFIDEKMLPYEFNVGSFWIFENDTTKTIDSIVVTSIENDFYWGLPAIHGQPGTKEEYYKINLKNFTTMLTYNDFITSDYIKRNGGGNNGRYGQPIYMVDREIGTEFNGLMIVEKLDSLLVNTHNFMKVDKVKITYSQQYQIEFENDTYLYYSDSIGLIKWETEFESWSIKRWKVFK